MKVKAAILQEFSKPLRLGYVDIPEPGDDESVLVRIVGAGMCKTDVRLWRGEELERDLKRLLFSVMKMRVLLRPLVKELRG